MNERTAWSAAPAGRGVARTRGPARSAFAETLMADLRAGFSRPQKELPPRYFYDERGSRLFEEITRLEEYYPTRAERALLAEAAAPWLAALAPAALVELGAGSAEKTRALLDALPAGAVYVPIDISEAFLQESARQLRAEYPHLRIEPVAGDMTQPIRLRADLGEPAVHALLGSTIGNFEDPEAVQLLVGVRARMRASDRLLLGADLVKDATVLERAYNDERGVTAEFNRNVLRVLNRELGADFRADRFRHVAFFDAAAARIEMHLVSLVSQQVQIPGWRTVRFARGETIRTEISNKYDRSRLQALLRAAGLELEHWHQHAGFPYALLTARPALQRA